MFWGVRNFSFYILNSTLTQEAGAGLRWAVSASSISSLLYTVSKLILQYNRCKTCILLLRTGAAGVQPSHPAGLCNSQQTSSGPRHGGPRRCLHCLQHWEAEHARQPHHQHQEGRHQAIPRLSQHGTGDSIVSEFFNFLHP